MIAEACEKVVDVEVEEAVVVVVMGTVEEGDE